MLMTRRVIGCLALLAATVATESVAQSSPDTIDPASLRRPSFTWTQAELEFGSAHWDSIFPGRLVPRGAQVRELPQGTPLAALSSGTQGAEALEQFIADQKVRA